VRKDKASLTCPECGSQQTVSRAAFSAVCRKCGQYLRVQELLKPAPKTPQAAPEQKQITCFDCGAALEVPASAHSTMCKRCSSYIDLHDYNITQAISRNFKTKGTLVIQPSGFVFNSEAMVSEATIKGRFIGKLIVETFLTLHSTADVKGSLTAARLLIPESNHVQWKGVIKVGSAQIAGELVSDLEAEDSVVIKAQGRLFGSVKARRLTIETGAVLVGFAEIRGRAGEQA
jgi:cytoskeletal protein CcmA (bactofilin family)/ribosomal protein S27E